MFSNCSSLIWVTPIKELFFIFSVANRPKPSIAEFLIVSCFGKGLYIYTITWDGDTNLCPNTSAVLIYTGMNEFL